MSNINILSRNVYTKSSLCDREIVSNNVKKITIVRWYLTMFISILRINSDYTPLGVAHASAVLEEEVVYVLHAVVRDSPTFQTSTNFQSTTYCFCPIRIMDWSHRLFVYPL